MILGWLAYVLTVSALVTVAAVAAERAAEAQGWPVRWVWAGALLTSVGLPAAAVLLPAHGPVAPLPSLPAGYTLQAIAPMRVTSSASSGSSLGDLLLMGWAAASLALVVVLVVAAVHLGRRRRGWSRRRVDGVDVLLSRSVGPAAVGIWRGAVVVPEWALELDPDRRRLLVRHEAEHVRAGDPRLALGALLVCALVPWNPVMWWQLRRLRLALELDCDARVLRGGGDARRYGSLLLEVGQRRAAFALGLAEPKSMLERRIRMITRTTTGRRTLRALALGAASALTLALALSCEAPKETTVEPTAPGVDAGAPADSGVAAEPNAGAAGAAAAAAVTAADFSDFGALFAHAYREEFQKGRLSEAYQLLADAGMLAKTEEDQRTRAFWMAYILYEQAQKVGAPMTARSAAEAKPLYQGALELFEAARGYEKAHASADVPKLIDATEKYIQVQDWLLGGDRVEAAASGEAPAPPAGEAEGGERVDIAAGPAFTPMTRRPMLENATEVRQALMADYPPELRGAGIGGTTNVWFFIDTDGRVKKVQVNKSSGHDALDQAALRVADVTEFTPAYNGNEKVPVWIALDIKFEVQ